MQVWIKYTFFILAILSLSSCRIRRDDASTSSVDSNSKMKLFATCVSETSATSYRNIIVQEDTTARKGILVMDNGETGTESQTVKSADLVIESQNNAEVRKIYTSGDMTFAIELKQDGNDTFFARLKSSSSTPDLAYNCAI